MRSAVAVLSGMLIFSTFAIAYGAVFAAVLLLIASGCFLIQAPGASMWSLVATILVSVPAAIAGGFLGRQRANQPAVRT